MSLPDDKDRARAIIEAMESIEGVLEVTDPDRLLEAIRQGIGPAKAFGFGLLSLAPAR